MADNDNNFFISDIDDIFNNVPFDSIKSSFANLTPREKEVLIFALNGFTHKYTAMSLCIKEGTVKKLLHNCYKKFSVNSKAELMKIFVFSNKN